MHCGDAAWARALEHRCLSCNLDMLELRPISLLLVVPEHTKQATATAGAYAGAGTYCDGETVPFEQICSMIRSLPVFPCGALCYAPEGEAAQADTDATN